MVQISTAFVRSFGTEHPWPTTLRADRHLFVLGPRPEPERTRQDGYRDPKAPFTEIPVGIMRGQPSPAAVTRVETSLDPSSYASREVSLHCSSLHHGRDVYVHSPHSTPTSTGCFLSNLPWCRVLERMALRRLGRRGEQGQAGGHSEVEDGVPVPEVAMHGLCLGAGGAPQKHLLDPS